MTLRTELGRLIEDAVNSRLADEESYVSNNMATSLEDYRRRCGIIAALRDVLVIADEAERKALRLDRDKK